MSVVLGSAAFTNAQSAAEDNSGWVTSAIQSKWEDVWRQATSRVSAATGNIDRISSEVSTALDTVDPSDWGGELLGLEQFTADSDFLDDVILPDFQLDDALGEFVDPGAPVLDTNFSFTPGTAPSFSGSAPQLNFGLSLPSAPDMAEIPTAWMDLGAFVPEKPEAPEGAPSFYTQGVEAALGGALEGVTFRAAPPTFAPPTRQSPLSVAIADIIANDFTATAPALLMPTKDSPLVQLEVLGAFSANYTIDAPALPTIDALAAKTFAVQASIDDLQFTHDVAAISTPAMPGLEGINRPDFGGYSVTPLALGDFRAGYSLQTYAAPVLDRYLNGAPEYTAHGIQFAPQSFRGFSYSFDPTAVGAAPDLGRYNFTVPNAPLVMLPSDVADVALSKIDSQLVAPDFSNMPQLEQLLTIEVPEAPSVNWAGLGQVTELDIPPAPVAPDNSQLTDFTSHVRGQEIELRAELDRILADTGGELRKLLPDFTAMREGAVKALVFGQIGEGSGNVAIRAFMDEHTVAASSMVERLSNAPAVNLSGRGFTMPNGLLAAAQRRQNLEAMQLMTQGYSAAIRQGMELISTHMLEGAKLSVDVHKYLEEAKFRWMSLVFEKTIEAMRMYMDVELRQAELDISIYNSEVEMHKANLEVLRMYMEQDKHKLEVARAQIEVFRARIEAEQAKGQLNTITAQVFETRVRAYLSRVDIFRAQVEARGQEVQMVEQELGVYRAQLDGYRAKVEAQVAKVDMYKTQVDAESTKVRLAEADTAMYRARIEGQTAVIQAMQAEVDAFKAETDAEAAKVQMARAHTDAFRAEVEAYQSRVSLADADLRAFVVQNEVEKSKADIIRSELEVYRTKLDAESAKVEIMKAERGSYEQEVQLEITKQNINAEKLRAFSSQIQLEAAKASMFEVYGRKYEVDGRVQETKARIYESQVQAFQSEVQAELAKVDVMKGRVDVFRTQAEIEQAKAQMVRTQADVYGAKAQVETQKMQLLEAQERLFATKVDFEKNKVDIYKTESDAYAAYVSALNAKASVEQMRADVYKTQVAADESAVAGFRAQVDAFGQVVQMDANAVQQQGNQLAAMRARGDALGAQAQVYGHMADVFKSEVSAEAAKADLGSARANMVRAYADMQNAGVSAYRAQVDAAVAGIQGETAKVQAFGAEVDAHKSAVDAYRASIEGQRAVLEARSQSNRAGIDAYVANVEGQTAALKARASAVEKQAAMYNSVTQRWGLALEAKGKIAELDVTKINYANQMALEAYKANLAKLEAQRALALEEVKLRVQGVTAQAQIHSTLAAGAMASINIGANMSTSASASLSSSTGLSATESYSFTD